MINSLYIASQKLVFNSFLKGISKEINSESILSNISKNKLDKYLSKKENIEYVYNTIRKSLTANSLKCTELLAIIVGEILTKEKEINILDITVIDALHVMNDFDLKNFYEIYNYIYSNKAGENKMIRLDNLYSNVDKNTIEISLNKLVNYQMFNKNTRTIKQGVVFNEPKPDEVMHDNEIYIFINKVSNNLYKLLNQVAWYN